MTQTSEKMFRLNHSKKQSLKLRKTGCPYPQSLAFCKELSSMSHSVEEDVGETSLMAMKSGTTSREVVNSCEHILSFSNPLLEMDPTCVLALRGTAKV